MMIKYIRLKIYISKRTNVGICLCYHHYKCNNLGKILEQNLEYILTSKKNFKMHFSSFKSKKENRVHHDYIDVKSFMKFLDIIKKYDQDIDIMIEATAKDDAVFRLLRQLKYYGYKLDASIYL